jgi:hypothetical protein
MLPWLDVTQRMAIAPVVTRDPWRIVGISNPCIWTIRVQPSGRQETRPLNFGIETPVGARS